MNIADHLQRARKLQSGKIALAVGAAPKGTYGELGEQVARLARGIQQLVTGHHNAHVAIVMTNSPQYLQILFACWHAGLVVVPINAKLHPKEISYILDEAECSLCFASPDLLNTVQLAANSNLIYLIDTSSRQYYDLLNMQELQLIDRKSEDPAWIFYTSGTTGRPKGAILTHGNLTTMAMCYFTDIDPSPPWEAIIHAAPMSHGSGLYSIPHVMKASCHVIPTSASFDASSIFSATKTWKNSVFFAAPTMLKRLSQQFDPDGASGIKLIIYGGGPMYLSDCKQALETFGDRLVQLYGQGESPMTITVLSQKIHADHNNPNWERYLSSVGVAQTLVKVRVADEQGRSLSHGQVGEVLVKGGSVMAGYWNNPDATSNVIKEGWLRTGDFGELDEDGFLTLRDRRNDLIISGGVNIYPREIEEVLVAHEDVSEASVVGRRDPDWGQNVVAYVVPRVGTEVSFEDLDMHCLSQMARFKRPKHYRIVSHLPKNNYGKVLKKNIRNIENKIPDHTPHIQQLDPQTW